MANPTYKQIGSMHVPSEGRLGSNRQSALGGYKLPADRHFIDERNEDNFESARNSLRGESNFQSVIEYDNSQYAMDGRINPLMLKKKAAEYYDPNPKGYSKAISPSHYTGQQRAGMTSSQASPFNQIRDTPQARIPSNRLVHINAPQQPQQHAGMGQSVIGSQMSLNRGSSGQQSPNNQLVQAQKISSPSVARLHPIVEDIINNNKVFQLYPVNSTDPVRNQMPFLIDPKKKIDLIKLIKDLIGKDITKIAIPAYLNEPISMLQRLTEPLEYKDLLDKAATVDDGALRLAYAMGMLFITYSNTPLRMKKPFNPLLGETFDLRLGNLEVVCEQVSHHPPISACFAKCKEYEMYACTNVESSIGMKSFQINPKGGLHVYFSKYRDHVWVKQCKTYVYNLIFGTTDVQHYGEMQGKNFTTGDSISFNLNDQGWTVKRPSEGTGKITDKNGNIRYTLKGDWKNDPYFHAIKPNGEVIEIVKRKANPANFEANYRFSYYTINMNHLYKAILPELCPTDCRLRPDTRALEYGNEDLAESEKKRLEQKQREKRKERETKGQKWEPRWFRTEYDMDSNEAVYRYRGGYWEAKSRSNWGDIESLY